MDPVFTKAELEKFWHAPVGAFAQEFKSRKKRTTKYRVHCQPYLTKTQPTRVEEVFAKDATQAADIARTAVANYLIATKTEYTGITTRVSRIS